MCLRKSPMSGHLEQREQARRGTQEVGEIPTSRVIRAWQVTAHLTSAPSSSPICILNTVEPGLHEIWLVPSSFH